VMVRLDIAEKLTRELHYLLRKHPILLPPNIGSRMGLKPDQLSGVLHKLGFRIIPAGQLGPKHYGPPNPALLARRKQDQAVRPQGPAKPAAPPEPVAIDADNPFAALAVLRQAKRR